jgi:hypothetical protein
MVKKVKDALPKRDYTTAAGVKRWMLDCGFATTDEAITASGIHWRTFYRYLNKGLPRGLAGELIRSKMQRILSARQASRK